MQMTDELRTLIFKEWEAQTGRPIPTDPGYILIGKATTVEETKTLTDKVLKKFGIRKTKNSRKSKLNGQD